MAKRNIVVTGGAGFLGSNLTRTLIDQGHDVTVIDNLVTGKVENIPYSTRFFKSCICYEDLMKLPGEWNVGIEQVYHLASPASPKKYQEHPEETYHANVLGTQAVFDFFPNAKVLFASSSEVYGEPAEHPQKETSWGKVETMGPRSIYDESKRMCETICHQWQKTGRKVVVARIFNTYGPGMDEEDGRVMINFIRQKRDGQPLTIYGNGSQTRSFCYVDDMVRGLILLMEKAEGVYNIGNPEETSILTLADAINTNPALTYEYQPLPPDDPTRRCPDITRIKTELGWEPKVSLEEGIEAMRTFYAH